MIGTGIYSRRKVNNVQDFLFGGRQMGPWISAFSYGTAYFSAVILLATQEELAGNMVFQLLDRGREQLLEVFLLGLFCKKDSENDS